MSSCTVIVIYLSTSSADGCAFLVYNDEHFNHQGFTCLSCQSRLICHGERGMDQSSYIGRICKAGILRLMPRRLPYCFVVAFLSPALQHGRHRSSNRLRCCCRSYALSFSRILSGMAFSPQILPHVSLQQIAFSSSLFHLCYIIDLPH